MRALLLVAAFVGIPLLEIYVLIQVGSVIGTVQAILLVLAVSVAGGWLLRLEGRRAWRALQQALQEGRLPDKELLNGALVLVGGTLLLTPGFVTDIFGMLLILPISRPLGRKIATWALGRHLARRAEAFRSMSYGTTGGPYGGFGPGGPGTGSGSGPGTGPGKQGNVVQGEVIDPS